MATPSRSGRVRKRPSKYEDYDDDFETTKPGSSKKAKAEKITISLKANKSAGGDSDSGDYSIVKRIASDSMSSSASDSGLSDTPQTTRQKKSPSSKSQRKSPVVPAVVPAVVTEIVTTPAQLSVPVTTPKVQQKPAKLNKSPRKTKQTVKTELIVDTTDGGRECPGIKLKLILSPKNKEPQVDTASVSADVSHATDVIMSVAKSPAKNVKKTPKPKQSKDINLEQKSTVKLATHGKALKSKDEDADSGSTMLPEIGGDTGETKKSTGKLGAPKKKRCKTKLQFKSKKLQFKAKKLQFKAKKLEIDGNKDADDEIAADDHFIADNKLGVPEFAEEVNITEVELSEPQLVISEELHKKPLKKKLKKTGTLKQKKLKGKIKADDEDSFQDVLGENYSRYEVSPDEDDDSENVDGSTHYVMPPPSKTVSEFFAEKRAASKKHNYKKMNEGKEGREEFGKKKKKKRRPRPITAYMLWARGVRPRIQAEHPDFDFASVSKRLGEIWGNLLEKDKMKWRRASKKLAKKGSTLINTGRMPAHLLQTPMSTHFKAAKSGSSAKPAVKTADKYQELLKNQNIPPNFRVTGAGPLDVAAHLRLLGESLEIVGNRLTEHSGLVVQGSLSLLLDSMVCALGPLMCLTNQVPELNSITEDIQQDILDNIAYIMPGM